MEKRVLEVNVDDLFSGGVYSLVRNVIINNDTDIKLDIAAIEPYENKKHVAEFNSYGSKVYYVGSKGNKLLKQIKVYRNLKKLIKDKKYDYVHIHADVANKLLVSGLAAKKAGVKHIILHSHAAGVDGNKRKLKSIVHKICRIKLPKVGNVFVSCSDLAAAWMFPKVRLEDVVMINNGIDLDRFRFSEVTRSKIREQYNIGSEILVGHVGRFVYQKNHEYMIDVFKRVVDKKSDVKLMLIGEGPDCEMIKEKVKKLGLEKNVIFAGVLPNVNEILSAMDVFILPSHFEGLPIVGVEAQAAGVPTLFSSEITREAKLIDSTEFIDINEDSLNVWADKILEAAKLGHSDTSEILEKKGFSMKNTVNTFMSLYR